MPDRTIVQWAGLDGKRGNALSYTEAYAPDVAWESLRTIESSPRAGVGHFADAGKGARALWQEAANYLRQARVYFDAGQKVEGTSSALLFYYCALQLAKAELLSTNSGDIVGRTIPHGLSHGITSAGNPKNDFLTVKSSGIFPLLYRKRIGKHIPPGTQLRVATLLQYVPEIGIELTAATGLAPRAHSIYHAMFSNPTSTWTAVLATEVGFPKDTREPVVRLLNANFEKVPAHKDWKLFFGLSPRIGFGDPVWYQSKKILASNNRSIDSLYAPLVPLHPYLDNPIYGGADAYLQPAMPTLKIPMTGSLARYCLMYYLSSLVRYKPVVLDPKRYPDYSWVLSSFCRMSALPLVVNAADSITGQWHIFGNSTRT